MKPILTLFLAASVVAGLPLVAQARMAQTPTPEARKAAASNLFEIRSSRLALQRSRNPAVRRFARQMIADHTALTARMNAMLARNGISPPAPILDSAHRYLLRQLATTPAPAFDRAYLSQQLNAHVQAVNLLSRYERRGANPVVRNAAANALPVVEQHLAMVRRMEQGRHLSASRRYGRRG
jgi:putative membrane protein